MYRPLIGLAAATPQMSGGRTILYGSRQAYVHAIEAAGGAVVLVPPQADAEQVATILDHMDGLVIPGGEDVNPARYSEMPHARLRRTNPERDEAEIALVRSALERHMPLLGICRGLQVINVTLGGTLYQDLAEQVPGTLRHAHWNAPRDRIAHLISIAPGTLLCEALGTTTQQVNSLHHQAIRTLGRGVRVTASAPDGVIEGIEIDNQPWAVAVQYHPEELVKHDPAAAGLFAALIAAARQPSHGHHRLEARIG